MIISCVKIFVFCLSVGFSCIASASVASIVNVSHSDEAVCALEKKQLNNALINVTFPPDVKNVISAINYLLETSNYQLSFDQDDLLLKILNKKLSKRYRHLYKLTTLEAITVLGESMMDVTHDAKNCVIKLRVNTFFRDMYEHSHEDEWFDKEF